MDHPADKIAELCLGKMTQYIGREVVQIDDSPGKECEPLRVWICLKANKWRSMKYVTKDINTEGSQGELIGWDSSRRVSLHSHFQT